MRITSGEFRGRLLDAPQDSAIRPTSDKIRHAIFNAILSRTDIDGATIIDACSGTGALGIEALSHGAAHAVFFDNNPSHLNLARANVSKFNLAESCFFIKADITKLKPKPDHIQTASLLFLDPPYRKNIIIPALQSLKQNQWINDDTLCVIESEIEFTPSFQCNFDRNYGDTRILMCAGSDL